MGNSWEQPSNGLARFWTNTLLLFKNSPRFLKNNSRPTRFTPRYPDLFDVRQREGRSLKRLPESLLYGLSAFTNPEQRDGG